MCRYWSLWALSASSWAVAWVGGWATGWQQGAARNANMMWQSPMRSMRTPALRLHVESLRLRTDARPRERSVRPQLTLVE